MNEEIESLVGLGLGIIFFAFLFIIAIYIISGLGYYKIFKKAGKKGWAGFVPYYNDWILVEISECHWWYYLIIISNTILSFMINEETTGVFALISGLLSLLSIYVILCINYNIAKKFHQGTGFAVGMTFLPFIFYLILGFSNNYQYDEKVEVSAWGIYDFDKKNINTKSYCPECGNPISGNFCSKCGHSKKGE